MADPVTISRGYVPGRFGQVHYRQADASSHRRTLVLLHQTPSSSFEYEPLIREMARDRRVIAFDTPGYGMSDSPPEPLSLADYAEALIEAALLCGVSGKLGCDVFGLHTGSLLAIEFALAAPDSVNNVACSGIPMRSAEERHARLQAARRAATALDEAGTAALALADPLWSFVVAQRSDAVQLRRAAMLWADKLAPIDRASWAYQGVWSYDYEARLPLIRQPFLLLQPEEEIAPQSRAAAALVPYARIVELAPFSRDILEIPKSIELIGQALRRFLDSSPH